LPLGFTEPTVPLKIARTGYEIFTIKDPDENQIGISPFFMQAQNTSGKDCPKAVLLGSFVPLTVSPGVVGKSLRSVYWMSVMLK
jgi:hypothetical protein